MSEVQTHEVVVVGRSLASAGAPSPHLELFDDVIEQVAEVVPHLEVDISKTRSSQLVPEARLDLRFTQDLALICVLSRDPSGELHWIELTF